MKYQFENKWITRLGYFVLLVLLLLSIIFYLERTLFIDIAFQSFHLIRTETPQPMVYRFGAASIQLFPLLAIKLSLPLKWVLLMYSMAYPILYLVVFTLIVKVLNNEWIGLAMVLLLSFTVFESFYWPVSELWQGLVMLLLFFAFVLRNPDLVKARQKIVIVLAVPFVLFYHPLVMIPFLFCWLFFYLHDKQLSHKWYYVILLLLIFSLTAKAVFFSNWYDDAKQGEFVKNLIQYFPNYFAVPAYEKFLNNSVKFYYAFPVLFFGLCIFYAKNKDWRKLVLLATFCLGHVFIVHLGSPNAAYRFYVEVSYLPLMVFCGVAFCFDVMPLIKNQRWLVPVLSLIFLIRLNSIYHAHQPFTTRLNWLKHTLAKLENREGNRFIMLSPQPAYRTDRRKIGVPYLGSGQKNLNDTLIMNWGIAYETLLLSSLEHPDSAKTIWITGDLKKAEAYIEKENYFLGEFNQIPVEELPTRYFNLGEGSYEVLKE